MVGYLDFKKEEYFKGLQPHLTKAEELFPCNDIAFIGLQGSQNYGLDTAESDFDSLALVLSNFRDLAFNRKAISGTFVMDDGSHLVYKDIRLFMNELRKGSLTALELLFTSAWVMNDKYKEEMNMLINNREKIAYADPALVVNNAKHMMLNSYKKGSCKSVSHAVRLCDFIFRYIEGKELYENILSPIDKQLILNIKYDKINYKEIAKTKVEETERICGKFMKDKDTSVTILLEEAQLGFMRKALLEEGNS